MKTHLASLEVTIALNKFCTITFILILIVINSCRSAPTSESDYYKEGTRRGQELATKDDPHISKSENFREDNYILEECKKYETELFERIGKKNKKFGEAHRRAYNKGCVDGFKASDQWKAYNLGWERGWAFAVSVLLEPDFDIKERCEDYASEVFSHNSLDRISRNARGILIDGCIDGYENNFDT